MAADDVHFRLRVPEGVKLKVEAAARAGRRSINTEIVQRLDASFTAGGASPDQLVSIDDRMRRAELSAPNDLRDVLALHIELERAAAADIERRQAAARAGKNARLAGYLLWLKTERDFAILRLEHRLAELASVSEEVSAQFTVEPSGGGEAKSEAVDETTLKRPVRRRMLDI
jgi:hypothetical protein